VKRYSRSLGGPRDVLASADPDGIWLYRNLVAPAQTLLKSSPHKDARIFIIPDGNLNNLNFETLLVTDADTNPATAKLHYWIEDVTLSNASSLRVLGASHNSMERRASSSGQYEIIQRNLKTPRNRPTLLLVGNSVSPNSKYPELPKAAKQMESVARHFPGDAAQIFAREQATPAAYLDSRPERFSYIHFVAHGTASRLSPLDSAIVLSKTAASNPEPPSTPFKAVTSNAPPAAISAEADSFKLYARDIVGHPLHANLVTISACYGAGERAYSGEGLVGLSWAFLFAGAHNVVAALWEASDASTEQLMDKFYDELDRGASPDAALRTAKLSLLRASNFRNPFYWAPFQLYAGS
jgi:CHAT domain-containing protein